MQPVVAVLLVTPGLIFMSMDTPGTTFLGLWVITLAIAGMILW